MISDEKAVLLRQNFLGLSDQIELFLLEIPIIQDFSAFRADKVVVMIGMIAFIVFIAALAVSGVDFSHEIGLIQEIEGPIDRRQSDVRVLRMEKRVDFLDAQMSLGSNQEGEYFLARGRPTRAMILHSVALAMLGFVLHRKRSMRVMVLVFIINNKYRALGKMSQENELN